MESLLNLPQTLLPLSRMEGLCALPITASVRLTQPDFRIYFARQLTGRSYVLSQVHTALAICGTGVPVAQRGIGNYSQLSDSAGGVL